jgi:hypothetical protein
MLCCRDQTRAPRRTKSNKSGRAAEGKLRAGYSMLVPRAA